MLAAGGDRVHCGAPTSLPATTLCLVVTQFPTPSFSTLTVTTAVRGADRDRLPRPCSWRTRHCVGHPAGVAAVLEAYNRSRTGEGEWSAPLPAPCVLTLMRCRVQKRVLDLACRFCPLCFVTPCRRQLMQCLQFRLLRGARLTARQLGVQQRGRVSPRHSLARGC